jgi:hypothetical protein
MTRIAVKTVPSGTQRKIERCAVRIDQAKKKGVELIFEIGQQLLVAHAALANRGDGVFGEWCKKRCGLSRSTAHRFMSVVQQFDKKQLVDRSTVKQFFTANSLYYLAREVTSETSRQHALKAAEKGKRITLAVAKQIVKANDQPDNKTIKIVPVAVQHLSAGMEWDVIAFRTTVRAEILKWWRVCPRDERKAILKMLRDTTAELEKRTKRRGHLRMFDVRRSK